MGQKANFDIRVGFRVEVNLAFQKDSNGSGANYLPIPAGQMFALRQGSSAYERMVQGDLSNLKESDVFFDTGNVVDVEDFADPV